MRVLRRKAEGANLECVNRNSFWRTVLRSGVYRLPVRDARGELYGTGGSVNRQTEIGTVQRFVASRLGLPHMGRRAQSNIAVQLEVALERGGGLRLGWRRHDADGVLQAGHFCYSFTGGAFVYTVA
jgi:hypothetical protein